jgi:transaldolase
LIDLVFDHICVSFGCKILERIKGFVSTEVDAGLSFHKNETLKRARRIIALYKQAGVDSNRVLIKIAATWEGIKAGEVLRDEGIKTNMTLIFHIVQAVACANSKLFLISPFIGRLLDWSKKEFGKTYDNPADDPGVIFVTEIFNYYMTHKIDTIIMGASFRNTGEIKEMAGLHRLTIAPALLDQLQAANGDVPLKLNAQKAATMNVPEIDASEENYRHQMNKSKLASDLFSAGIRSFEDAGHELKTIIRNSYVELYQKKE